jgi:serine/threonine protein kinase
VHTALVSLELGTRLGHYMVVAPLGAGGMGEVYRASDTKLGRDVALKVLPANLAHDSERLARFQREARAVVAFNHPNIVTIYSVEEADGDPLPHDGTDRGPVASLSSFQRPASPSIGSSPRAPR